MKSCDSCTRPATHRLRSGWLLCTPCADRVDAAAVTERERRRPIPLEPAAQPDLFGGAA